jgi:hypothetical protein
MRPFPTLLAEILEGPEASYIARGMWFYAAIQRRC